MDGEHRGPIEMIGALGGLTMVAMPFAYRVDKRLIPAMWTVAAGGMLAAEGGLL